MAGDVRNEEHFCTANKTNGEPCTNYAIRGLAVCRYHGGGTVAARAAATRRLADGALAARLAQVAPDLDIEPTTDAEADLRTAVGFLDALVAETAKLLAKATEDVDKEAALSRLQSLLRDANGVRSTLLQHGTVSEPEDDLSGLERLERHLLQLEAQRDATSVRCSHCDGIGYMPRFSLPAGDEPDINDLL